MPFILPRDRKPTHGVGGTSGSNTAAKCQRCLKPGKWTYECGCGKEGAASAYVRRASASERLRDPKLRQKFAEEQFAGEAVPDAEEEGRAAREGVDRRLGKVLERGGREKRRSEKKRRRRRSPSSSSSSSSGSRSRSTSSGSGSSSYSSSSSSYTSDSGSSSRSSGSSSRSSRSSSYSSSSSSSSGRRTKRKR